MFAKLSDYSTAVLVGITVLPEIQNILPEDLLLISEYIDQFRFQFIFLLLLFAFFSRKINLVITILLIVFNLYVIFIQSKPHQDCATQNMPLTVMTYNVWRDNKNQDQIVQFIQNHDPDVIWIQELKVGFYHKARQQLQTEYPYFYPPMNKASPQGMVLISKYPFKVIKGIHEHDKEFGKFLHVTLDVNKKPIDFFGVHFKSPKDIYSLQKRNYQIKGLFHYLIAHQKNNAYFIMGDMNNVYWNTAFKPFYDYLGLQKYHDFFNIHPTWPSSLPAPLQIPIDHIMLSREGCFKKFSQEDAFGSDHHSLKAVIKF